MSEIQTTKIDGVEFVTYKDYLRLKEEKQELEYLGDINEDLKKDNEELKKDNQELKGLVDINRKLRKENKKLKEELKERNKLIRDIVLNFHRIDENKILELLLKIPTE